MNEATEKQPSPVAKINVYFGAGPRGAELRKAFGVLANTFTTEEGAPMTESQFCQYLAENSESIRALLVDEYNGVDLGQLTEFIKMIREYNTTQLYALIENRAALEAILKAKG